MHANQQLQSFEFKSSACMALNELSNMIIENRSISKLVVNSASDRSISVKTAELMRFASEHPNLIELEFMQYQLSANDVIVFLRQLNSLRKFAFFVRDRFNMATQCFNWFQQNVQIEDRIESLKMLG